MINYNAIEAAFENDENINIYCDPSYENKSIKEIIDSTYNKILEYEEFGDVDFEDIIENGELIGFICCFKDKLISFGINIKYRNKEILTNIFEIIKNKFNTEFETYMWSRNERAINWLKKCGMKQIPCNIDNVTKLKYN